MWRDSVVVTFLCILGAAEATPLGALKLDNYTFDRFLSIPGYSTLVKFDQSYAFGEKEDEFKALCKLAHGVPSFFVAEVPVQEYGEMENDVLRERFNLKKEDYPAYFLFSGSSLEGLKYDGSVRVDDLALWLRKNKVQFPSIGTISELDTVVQRFMREGLAEEHLEKAKTMADSEFSNDKKASVYIKLMQKVKEKGESYIATETERVTKLLSGHVTPEKRTELTDKMRVLNVFTVRDEL